jgi:hypothetical protein
VRSRDADRSPSHCGPQALAEALGCLCLETNGEARYVAIDGKTMRASRNGDGKAEHVLSAFCDGLQTMLQQEASRGKGFDIPEALRFLERLDLKGKIVTGDAIFCQKSITEKILERGGDYVLPIKGNQKNAQGECRTGLQRSDFFPLASYGRGAKKDPWTHRTASNRGAASGGRRHRR